MVIVDVFFFFRCLNRCQLFPSLPGGIEWCLAFVFHTRKAVRIHTRVLSARRFASWRCANHVGSLGCLRIGNANARRRKKCLFLGPQKKKWLVGLLSDFTSQKLKRFKRVPAVYFVYTPFARAFRLV